MAYVSSTEYTAGSGNSYGNIPLKIKIYRGDCTRTERSVSFSFGVGFQSYVSPSQTSNSIIAEYNGTKKFAQASYGHIHIVKDKWYHAYYDDRSSERQYTSETLCFTYSNSSISATTTSVSVPVGVGWADYSGTKRGTITFSLSIPEYHGTVGIGTVSITDNYNNTFTLNGTKGASGINNPSTGPILKWGYNTKYSNTFTNGSTITLSASGDTSATRTVYAKSITGATYGDDQKIATAQLDVRQYIGPGESGKPVIFYNKNRLTTKENWWFSWTTAIKINDSSPVMGYRIRLYRKRGNSDFIKLPIYDSDGKNLSIKAVSGGDIYYDKDGNYPFIYIYPAYYSKAVHPDEPDILPGDQIKLTVNAYTRYGKDNTGNQLFKTSEVASDVSTVQNAGIMRVKVGGTWKEGQVYVKVGGAWKEAEVVQTKVNGYWKESE